MSIMKQLFKTKWEEESEKTTNIFTQVEPHGHFQEHVPAWVPVQSKVKTINQP